MYGVNGPMRSRSLMWKQVVQAVVLAATIFALGVSTPSCDSRVSRDEVRQRLREDAIFIREEILQPMVEAAVRAAVEEALRKAPDLSGIQPGKEEE